VFYACFASATEEIFEVQYEPYKTDIMKNLKTPILALCVGLLTLLTAGCSSQKSWVYRANSFGAPAVTSEKKVAVLPFADVRENVNNNFWAMYMIPILPFGWQSYNTPEGSSMHMNSGLWVNYKPSEDFPKALAEDLRNTRLFSDAFFDYRRESGDYAVYGKILNTKYNAKMISYCTSVYCPYLWIVGFPATWTENQLSVELSLVDAKTQKELFAKTYTAEPRSNVSWIYYINNDFNYPDMLQSLNRQFCEDIQPVITGREKK
jgi:hypothetical protein